jgi:uncharacterized protein (UPF0332 family)
MSKDEQVRHWHSAKAKRAAAGLCFQQGFYSESITLSYYACYQAMWVAMGDPPAGLWRHGGLMNEFCRTLGYQSPSLRKRLDKLYLYRVQSDYEARSLGVAEAQESLDITDEVLRIVAQQVGLAL